MVIVPLLLPVLLAAPKPPSEIKKLVADMVAIPAGEFTMGSDAGEPDEAPPHLVRLPQYRISRHEVTNAQYAAFVKASGHRIPGAQGDPSFVAPERLSAFREIAAQYAWRAAGFPEGKADHPVVLITIDDAIAFCAWMSKMMGREYRLATEAEWERAARGGLEGKPYPWGDGLELSRANYLKDQASKASSGTKPVGSYAPNGFGLFDMAGNAWEWVGDLYDGDYYKSSPRDDPKGPASGAKRIVRGGAWVDGDPKLVTCSHRHEVDPGVFSYSISFRVVTGAK